MILQWQSHLLASHVPLPREGHLEAVFPVFVHLMVKHNSQLALDLTYPQVDINVFVKADWKDFYGDVTRVIPDNMLEP